MLRRSKQTFALGLGAHLLLIVRVYAELRNSAAVVMEVSRRGCNEYRSLKCGQSYVALVAENPANVTGGMVVIDNRPPEVNGADRAAPVLGLNHRVQVVWCHAKAVAQSIAQGPISGHASSVFMRVTAFFAPRCQAVSLGATTRESGTRFCDAAGQTRFLGNHRFWPRAIAGVIFAAVASVFAWIARAPFAIVVIPTELAPPSYTKRAPRIAIKVVQWLVGSASHTYLHNSLFYYEMA